MFEIIPNFVYMYAFSLFVMILSGLFGFVVFDRSVLGMVIFQALFACFLVVLVPYLFEIGG